MRKKLACRAFYLAVFALFTSECRAQGRTAASASTNHHDLDVCAFQPGDRVSDACASYADLDSLNNRLHPYVRNLANNTDFFSYYRLNLYDKKCPFWNDDNGLCGNIACAVTTIENEEDIPKIWRAEELSRLEGPRAEHPGRQQQRERQRPLQDQLGENVDESCVVEYDDECDERDYCMPEDESASAKGDYVSLVDNPERFTGYAGEAAHQVWETIYRENCFSRPQRKDQMAWQAGVGIAPVASFSQNQAQAAQDFRSILKAHDRQQALQAGEPASTLEFEDECLEKRVFFRVISGMHAAISTHLCHDYLNQTTGEWGPNVQCYKERLHDHPERISNLYFNYAFVLRAVGKLRDYVQDYTFCTGDVVEDGKTKEMIKRLSAAIPEGPKIFDESVMFQDQSSDGINLKEDFRNRFRNVSRIMDCVGCDKCRLWGKVQTNGFGTALKVLFEFGNGDGAGVDRPLLRRTELVALINTLDKISSALKALEYFRGAVLGDGDDQPSTPAKAQQPGASESAFGGLDELDDFDEPRNDEQGRGDVEPSFGELFRSEWDMFTHALVWVIKSWLRAPGLVLSIAKYEAERLLYYWLGYDLPPRTWRIEMPTREDVFREEL